MTNEQRNAIENLLQLCPSCHDLIDKNDMSYTADRLRSMKVAQEAKAAELIQVGRTWTVRYSSIDYLNLPRISAIPDGAAIERAASESGIEDDCPFYGQGMRVGRFVWRLLPIFESWRAQATPLSAASDEEVMQGMLTSFEQPMRGRNTPTLPSKPLTGNPDRDPYLYCKIRKRTARIRFDPAWLTTATATADLSSSKRSPIVYAGIGRVVAVANDEIHISALVFGQPETPAQKAWDDAVARRESHRENLDEVTWTGERGSPF